MAEESPQEVVIANQAVSSLPQKEVSVVTDVAHLGKVGSPEKCFLADLHVKFHINHSLPGSQGLRHPRKACSRASKKEAENFRSGEKREVSLWAWRVDRL